MYEKRSGRDTSTLAMLLFRGGIFLVFVTLVVRLFTLQIVEGEQFTERANRNRLELVETAAPRGVIYDANNTILVRNRPSFEVSLVPEDLVDDLEETEADEEAAEIEKVLRILRADTDKDVALRIAELMFKRLGYNDYVRTLEKAGVAVTLLDEPAFVQPQVEDDRLVPVEPRKIYFPDITVQLPLPGLTVLIQRALAIGELGSASDPVPILDGVDRIRAFEVSEEIFRIPSVRVNQVPVREYVYGPLLAHALGFMGPIPAFFAENYTASGYTNPNEKVGLNGLEAAYQTELRGIPGKRNVERDILGSEVRTVGAAQEPVPGLNLHLGIDLRLQKIMNDALQTAKDQTNARWAVAIAMDPMTGLIKGLVSLPAYDNNIFAERIGEDYLELEKNPDRPLINYAIGGLYPPGSVYKMVTSAAALAEGVIDEETTVRDAGPIYLPNKFFPNDSSLAQEFVSWNHKLGIVHGAINVVQALALSNDIFYYYIGGGFPLDNFVGLGQRALSKWSELFGFGETTGVDLPGEVTSIVPTDQWKRQTQAESWTTGDSYNMSIGQGYVLATPMQVLVETAAVANGGYILEPRVVHHMTDSNGGLQMDFDRVVKRQLPLTEDQLRIVQEGMWTAVNSDFGTATAVRVPGVTIAAKTGTAEFCEYIPELEDCRRPEGDEDILPTHAWFVAYAPYEAPEIAVVVFVYDGGEGSATALPVAKAIIEAYFTEIAPRPPAAAQP